MQSEVTRGGDLPADSMPEAQGFFSVPEKVSTDAVPVQSLKMTGGVDNFREVHAVICRMLFDYSLQVVWNAVSYDMVAEYSSAWRSKRLWSYRPHYNLASSGHSDRTKKIEKIPAEAVSLHTVPTFLLFWLHFMNIFDTRECLG